MAKTQSMKDFDTTELKAKAGEMQEQMFRLKFQMNMGQTDGVKKYRGLRKDRARMLTVLNERKKEGAEK